MAYSLRHADTSLRAGVARLAMSQVDAAIDALRNPGQTADEKVYAARRRIKKVRALLRLVRPGLREFRRMNDLLRDTARSVGPVRDAAVRMETFDRMIPEFGATLSDGAIARIRHQLTAERERVDPDTTERQIAHIDAVLQGVRADAYGLALQGDEEDILAGGVLKTLRRARKALSSAQKSGDPDVLHEWRKHVKIHSQHMRLLRHLWPEELEPRIETLRMIAGELGTHHDIFVLTEIVTDKTAGPGAAGAVHDMAASRLAAIEARVYEAAPPIFAAPPREFAFTCAARWSLRGAIAA